jgi:hypothetical protein
MSSKTFAVAVLLVAGAGAGYYALQNRPETEEAPKAVALATGPEITVYKTPT